MALGRGTPAAPLPASLPTVVALRGPSYNRVMDWKRVGGFLATVGVAFVIVGVIFVANNTNVGGPTGEGMALVGIGVVFTILGIAFIIGGGRSAPPQVAQPHIRPADRLDGHWTPAGAAPPLPAAPPPPGPPAGWYPDPHKRYEQRYWDGSAWTDSVLVNGESILEPPSFY